MTRWITSRKAFTVLSLAVSSWLQYSGKLGDGSPYALIVMGLTAGHHAPDIIKAWRGNASSSS